VPSDAPPSEVAAAAAAAETSGNNTVNVTSVPTVTVAAASPSRSASSRRSSTSAGSELRSAKQTLKDRERQLHKVSVRSADMSNNASNFATVAQGFLELSAKKK